MGEIFHNFQELVRQEGMSYESFAGGKLRSYAINGDPGDVRCLLPFLMKL